MITIGSTDGVTKDKWNRYTFRSGMGNSQEANSLALYTAKKYPKLTKFYNIGPDYEYGRTMWALFQAKTKELNPKAQFIGEQWPKLAIPDYTSYINAILQAKPDAVFCSPLGRGPRRVLQAGEAVRPLRQDEVGHRHGRGRRRW